MSTESITLPAGKTLTINRDRFRTVQDHIIDVSAMEPVKKQKTAMRKLICPKCQFIGRATKKYKDRMIICAGTEATPHEGEVLQWVDDSATTEEGE